MQGRIDSLFIQYLITSSSHSNILFFVWLQDKNVREHMLEELRRWENFTAEFTKRSVNLRAFQCWTLASQFSIETIECLPVYTLFRFHIFVIAIVLVTKHNYKISTSFMQNNEKYNGVNTLLRYFSRASGEHDSSCVDLWFLKYFLFIKIIISL